MCKMSLHTEFHLCSVPEIYIHSSTKRKGSPLHIRKPWDSILNFYLLASDEAIF